MEKRAVLSGYATLDFVVGCAQETVGPGAYLADIHCDSAWPRAGGAALYAGGRLAAAGIHASPLVRIGDDANGAAYAAACESAGVSSHGVVVTVGRRSPCCVLVHHDAGSVTCFLDPGTVGGAELSDQQVATLHAADLVVICAGDEAITGAVLDRLRPGQTLAWIAKADTRCFPLPLRSRILARATTVFFNRGERGFVEEARQRFPAEQLLIETRGPDGVLAQQQGESKLYRVDPVERVADATGAGDTFAGAFLGAQMAGADRDGAIAAAIAQTSAFLGSRVAGSLRPGAA